VDRMTTITAPTTTTGTDPLKRVLLLDAVVTGGNGLAYVVGATTLDDVLGASPATLRGIGVFLVVFAAAVAVVATRRPIPSAAVRELMVANAVWVGVSVGVAATGALGLDAVGRGWAVAQALVVAGFVALQRWGLAQRA